MRESATSARVPATELTALEGLLQDAASLVESWPLFRDHRKLNIDAYSAFDVLATWNHLRRFPAEKLEDEAVKKLDQLVHDELRHLAPLVLNNSFMGEAWMREAERLHECYDHPPSQDDPDGLGRSVRQHFFDLDEHSLVADALECLMPDNPLLPFFSVPKEQREQIKHYVYETRKAENLLEEKIKTQDWLFLDAASLAQANFEEYRPDLITYDVRLWRITLKYRFIYENWLIVSDHSITGQGEDCYGRPPSCFPDEREAMRKALDADWEKIQK